MEIEYYNFNHDPLCDPEIRPVKMSIERNQMPPTFCLPWVQSSEYCIQIKANADYKIKKKNNVIEANITLNELTREKHYILVDIPENVKFLPANKEEMSHRVMPLSITPSFSSPWQKEKAENITIKTGICWWTPPETGLLFCSPIHQKNDFKIVEGFVRTDLWHRDIPIIVEPFEDQITIKKYSIIASAYLVQAKPILLKNVTSDKKKKEEVIKQINQKRINPSIYKKLVLQKPEPENQ